jgi:Immunity protein 22
MQEHKRVEGAVSLWVGVSPSQDALENYVEIDYSTNDLSTISQFADDFGTGWHDEDFMEIAVEKSTRSLSELLQGCSYDSVIIPKFVNLCGGLLPEAANAFVLLYNFQHNGSVGPGADSGSPVKLRYMGSIKVKTPWPD